MKLQLAKIFSDNLVLQQGTPVAIWGSAAPGATVRVAFKDQLVEASAGSDGRFRATLAPLDASPWPDELRVTAKEPDGEECVTLSNVLVGEVWICSGQSNMELSIKAVRDAEREIADADYPMIRLKTVPKRICEARQADLTDGGWEVCSPKTLSGRSDPPNEGFSAVAYFFGRELYRRLGVPIGLIHASWGGTVVEAWTSREGLLADPAGAALWNECEQALPEQEELTRVWRQEIDDLQSRARDVANIGFAKGYASPAEPCGEWGTMTLPANWFTLGFDFNGVFWFRKELDLPAAWAGKDVRLSVGSVDKNDITYFNGEQVGSLTMQDRPDAWSVVREYLVPGRLVKAGRNLTAVRCRSEVNDAGMRGPDQCMWIDCPAAGDRVRISLAGDWKYAIEANYGRIRWTTPPVGSENPNTPTYLFNGMIAPVADYAVRGAIWYQGESNATRPVQYRALFQALIRDWRVQFGQPDLPFYFVQLANFQEQQTEPGESDWALLRESQAAALALPNTGMAVTIDIGEANDIHPRNKQDVGLRLALSALQKTYGRKDIVASGPVMRSVEREGNRVRVRFDCAAGLAARSGKPAAFAIAGDDHVFVRADASIDGESVVLQSSRVRLPRAVRYGWADNPGCDLYNGAGLPAAPFRADLPR